MSQPTLILKLGGSVLAGEACWHDATQEIFRWRREGLRVLAVVSARLGTTDRILEEVATAFPRARRSHVANRLASGELESAARLGLELDRAGLSAGVLSPAAARFVAEGDPLAAEPRSIDAGVVERALTQHGVVVFPGFVATDAEGETVTLGRGGSDLTAVFLAARLGAARCRLIKDVNGLYEWDPKRPGPLPRRYAALPIRRALSLDEGILQHRALRHAAQRGVAIEVAGLARAEHTLVGERPGRFHPETHAAPPLRVAVLGLGTVGGGAIERILRDPHLELVAAAARDRERSRPELVGSDVEPTTCLEAAASGADVVVEAIGGIEPARTAIETALRAGSDVITANKAVLAHHGDALARLARAAGRRLLTSASVGGAVPVLETLRASPAERPARIRAVLNGTTGFVIDRIAEGASTEEALRLARAAGLAEADASRDLDGRDAADKVRVIAAALGAGDLGEIARTEGPGLAEPGVRQVASLWREDGTWRASVGLEVPPEAALRALRDEENAAVFTLEDGRTRTLRGRGAGREPTVTALLGDLHELLRARDLEAQCLGPSAPPIEEHPARLGA